MSGTAPSPDGYGNGVPRATGVIHFTVPPDLFKTATTHAEARGLTVHEYIRDKVIDALTRQQAHDQAPAVGKGDVTPRWKTQREKAR